MEIAGYFRPAALLLGSLILTAHIFVFNDWSDYDSDHKDPNRATRIYGRAGVGKVHLAYAAGTLLVLANAVLAFVGSRALMLGGLITLLGFLYSVPSRFGKRRPFAASANHLAGGTSHFLLGYTVGHPVDAVGMAFGAFFGLVFAAGHLNQEIRDYEGDRISGIRTCAVVYGCQCAFAGSIVLFSLAYLLPAVLAALGILPALFLWCPVLLLVHVAGSLYLLRRGLGYETANRMQRLYRVLFAIIGLSMLLD